MRLPRSTSGATTPTEHSASSPTSGTRKVGSASSATSRMRSSPSSSEDGAGCRLRDRLSRRGTPQARRRGIRVRCFGVCDLAGSGRVPVVLLGRLGHGGARPGLRPDRVHRGAGARASGHRRRRNQEPHEPYEPDPLLVDAVRLQRADALRRPAAQSWIGLFARHGFFRNVDLDASFIAPHAVHLVRSTGTPVAVAQDYERWHWRHRAELVELRQGARRAAEAEAQAASEEARNDALVRDLREEVARLRNDATKWRDEAEVATAQLAEWNAFRGRSGYRIFLRFANLRSKLAPAEPPVTGSFVTSCARSPTRWTAAPHRFASAEGQTGIAAVLFVSACPGDTMRYRRDHQAAELGAGRDYRRRRGGDRGQLRGRARPLPELHSAPRSVEQRDRALPARGARPGKARPLRHRRSRLRS